LIGELKSKVQHLPSGEILERDREERFSAGKDYEEELRKKVQGPRGEV
jgi:hypothetical protein